MASTSNVLINSRSMNGIITISDGIATLENGDLTCDDINSDTFTTNNLNSNVFTCNGEIRSNLVGPYTIPTFTSSLTGSLISYGNTLNSGATDFTNYGSTYNLLKQGFYFNNINSTTPLTNLAIIDNSQTYFKSQLVGCTAETPLNTTSIVNKTYCDSNFVDRTNNLTQDINGLKNFTDNLTITNLSTFQPTLTFKASSGTTQQGLIRMEGSSFKLLNNSTTPNIIFTLTNNTRLTVYPTQFLLDATCFLTTNDIKSRASTAAHTLLSDITTGSLVISSATSSNTINGATQLNQQTTFNNFTPFSSVATPTAVNHLTRKDYVDSNFVDRVNTLQQNINGLKTFTNNTNFTGTLLARTNIKLSEYENSPSSNNVTLTFPMPETIALRTTSLTNNPMTITLPALTNNERGYVFTFNKLFNATYGNFSATFQTSGGNYIFTLLDQGGAPTSNTTLLSIDKIQCKLAVGFFGTTNYWIEQTDFSTYDRFKLQEWQNATTTNSLILSFPLPPTIAIRASTASMMTITLPTLTTNDRGKIFTFVKINLFKFDVTFNTSSSQWIFPLNNLTGSPTTNTSIFPSTKVTTRLAVAWFAGSTYWIEVSDYSTLDIETNNGRYVDFTSPQIISGEKSFNTSLPTSTLVPSSSYQLVNKIYTDTNFQLISNMNNYIDITSPQNIAGVKTFSSLPLCSVVPSTADQLINKFYSDTTFQLISNMTNYVNITSPQNVAGIKTFSSLPLCSVVPSTADQLVNKSYVDGMPVHGILNSTNAWTGFNSFNTNLPTSTITPTTQYQLVNKNYVDGMPVHGILNSTNDWTGFNSFNTNLPTSTVTPTTLYQLVNKNYTDTTFQLISNMTNYVNVTSPQNVAGVKTFSSLPLCSVVPSTTDQLINKLYSDTNFQLISNMNNYVNITSPQNVAGIKTFSSLPLCSVVPSTADQLVNKNYTDTKFQLISNMSNYVDTSNAQSIFGVKTFESRANFNGTTAIVVAGIAQFDGTTNFTTNLPTCSITATTSNQLVNYTTLTTQGYITSSSILSASNTWTGFNSFNTNLPTSTLTATTQHQLVNKSYVDGMPVHGILSATNAWTGFNSFNTNLPTSTLAATSANQLVNYTTLTTQGYTTLPLVQGNANTFTNTNEFTGDVILSKTKNNSTYATYNGLNSTYIGYMSEVIANTYLGIGSGTQYQLGAITRDSTNVGFWTCNYEVEINCITAGSISKIYVFVSNNSVSTTVPIGLPGAKANNFSTQTYAINDSTYHSGSFSFLQSTTTVIYGVQLIAVFASGTFQRKGQIRMLRIL